MRKIKFLSLLVLFALGFTSCEKDLEIEPEQSLSTNASFSDKNTALASLNGVYSRMQSIAVYGSQPQIIADYQADNVNFVGSFPTLQEINDYLTLSDNATIETIWRDHYRVILAANAVIKFAPDVEDASFTADDKAEVVAEAKFLRALSFFNLVNLFAQPYTLDNGASPGIPLQLEPNILEGKIDFPARATVAETYNQIEKDLTEALPNLADNFNPGRATQGAANALLARLNLYKENWSNVVASTGAVIGKQLFSLASDYSFWGMGTTQEDVFALINTETDNGATGAGGWASYYQPAELGGRGDCPFSQNLLDAYAEEPGDRRFTELNLVAPNGSTFTTKFPDAVTNSDNSPVLRYTEVLLNRAEALARQTNSIEAEALDIINQLRERAGLSTFSAGDFADASTFIDQILVERRKELAFEGHRRMDLLRIGKPLRTEGAGAGVSSPGDPKIILPIPQREIDLNASLDQNPGY